jgi:DNA-binding helix-hairpin-helix protein with protein kinase domain
LKKFKFKYPGSSVPESNFEIADAENFQESEYINSFKVEPVEGGSNFIVGISDIVFRDYFGSKKDNVSVYAHSLLACRDVLWKGCTTCRRSTEHVQHSFDFSCKWCGNSYHGIGEMNENEMVTGVLSNGETWAT